jgi:nucleoside-diphosphate-sugar epimerase
MRVFVAGGAGVIGRRLVPQLVAAGHTVVGTTRRPERVAVLKSMGAEAALCNALDAAAVTKAVREAAPDVVMNQLTELPTRYDPRKLGPWYEKTSRLRVQGTENLLAAALSSGARRFIYQSIAFMYAPRGPRVLDEDAPLAVDAPEPFGATVRATLEGEQLTLRAERVEGVVLRYGWFYGPGTYFAPDGDFARQARQRRLPLIGSSGGVSSFLHVDDAASATICALDRGRGAYNVADDDPAPAGEWIPVFCKAVNAPGPFHVPAWLARLLAGAFVVETMERARGASNARAKRDLGWEPRYRSWREGFFARN